MGNNYACMFPICSASIWQEIWHICTCLIYREKLDLYAERLNYSMKESLYAERKGYYSFLNNNMKIVLRAFYMAFLFIFFIHECFTYRYVQASTFACFVVHIYRVVGRPSYKMNICPPFPRCTSDLAPDNPWLGTTVLSSIIYHLSNTHC